MNIHSFKPRHFALDDFQPDHEVSLMAQDQQTEPAPEEQPMPALPRLTELQRIAFDLGIRAQQMHTSAQLILQDLWRQNDDLSRDAGAIEEERMRHITEINRAFDQRRNVNMQQLQAVQSQIAYYSHDPMAMPAAMAEPMALPSQRTAKRHSIFGFWKK